MSYNMKEVNETHHAIKEFFARQVTFHASMNTLLAGMADILPTLDDESKETFEQLLKPFYAIQNNPFALTTSEADIIHGTYDTPEEKLEASALGIRLIENKLSTTPPIFFSSMLECMGVYPAVTKLMLSLSKKQQDNINSRFNPDSALSLFIKASQQATRYAMPLIPLEKFTDPQAEIHLLNTKILPIMKNIAANADNHLDTITLKNQAIGLLIEAKHAKLDKFSTNTRKKSIALIDEAIEAIQALPLADTYEEREQFVSELNHILSGTTSREDLGKSYQNLTDSMRDFILKKATPKQPAAPSPTEAPSAQIKSPNVDLTAEDKIKKIETELGGEWNHEKLHTDVTFQKKVNNEVTHSFVVKNTSISTNDKDSDTYRAMIMAFKGAHPEKTLRMRTIDATELQKVEAICREIQSEDATFKYTLTINEIINTSPDMSITEPKQVAPEPPTTPWKEAVLPEEYGPINANTETSAAEPTITDDAPQAPTTSWKAAVPPEEYGPVNADLETHTAEARPENAIPVIQPPVDIIGQEMTDIPPVVNSIQHLRNIKNSILESSNIDDITSLITTLDTIAKEDTHLKEEITAWHIEDIKEKVKTFTSSNSEAPLQKALNTLKGTLDKKSEQIEESSNKKKGGILNYLKNKITSGYKSIKSSYKEMSTLQKVGFWIGTTVAVAAFAGMIVGLTIATGGAAPAIGAGTGAMTGLIVSGKLTASICALVGVAGAVFSAMQIKKNPISDKRPGLSSTGLIDEVMGDNQHSSDSDIKERLGANQPANVARKKRGSTLTTHSNPVTNPPLAPLPTAEASAAPEVAKADDEEGDKKHPTLGK